MCCSRALLIHNRCVDNRPPRAAVDPGAALWIAPRLSGQFGAVTRTVPAGFAAYARIFHPADPGAAVHRRWSEVAAANGRIMHQLAQYARISTPAPGRTEPAPLAGIQAPATGDLEPACLRSVCEILARHTPAPAQCWFAVWEGWGDLDGSGHVASFGLGGLPPQVRRAPAAWQLDLRAPKFALPHRVYYLFNGPVGDAVKIGTWVNRDRFLPRSPNIFWPGGRSWCIASEIDFDSTIVGGTTDLIADVLHCDDLEAWPVAPDDSLAWDGDTINQP